MSVLPVSQITGTPPVIPAARVAGPPDYSGHVLFWVHTGAARVRVDDRPVFQLVEGEGVWLPAGGWDHREITTELGTVAFPLWADARSVATDGLSEPTRFAVPDGWRDWLIQYFGLLVTPSTGLGYASSELTQLVSRSVERRQQPTLESNLLFDPPTMPRGSGARAVAEELTRDPAVDLTIHQWAARVLSSPRTLLRDFLADTGLTFEQWRLRCRIAAAVEYLAAGYDVDQVTVRVGFGSRNGFTRAFKERFGSTPHEFRSEVSARPRAGSFSQRVTTARQGSDLARMVRGDRTSADAPRLLPATRTPLHANAMHVLTWAYRGTGYLDIGARRYQRRRGVATWIPAVVEHRAEMCEDSVSLPLGDVDPADFTLTEPLQVQFSPAWDDYLMFCSVSARSPLRPDGYDPAHILDLFHEQVAARRALTLPMPRDPRAKSAATSYLRRYGTSSEPATFDLSADVHRAFRDETGMTFASWRYAARMRIARDLLVSGAKPSAVARRVGYTLVSNFSHAFTRFHGISPREYQERETGPA